MTDISNPKILKMLKSSGWLKGGTTKGEEGNNQMFSGKAVDTNIQSTTPQKFTCAVCGLPTLTCCSICKSVFYCSAPHQKLHWYSILPLLFFNLPPGLSTNLNAAHQTSLLAASEM